ncbi:MAG: bacterial transcriptional activator domain-containing protein [Eubacteriales bacterium]|nr:bacterial transcriptional activator domain-containing protein [Eubacteriales bacterium]
MKIYITTLGEFDIRDEEKSLFNPSNRTYTLYKLLQYFITFRNRKILPETIIDNLMAGNETDDPKNVLRTQIFRLRQMLKKMEEKHTDEGNHLNIIFANGNYSLEIGDAVEIDIDAFESMIEQGDSKKPHQRNEAIELYRQAMDIYKGTYLSQNPYEVWLVPIRNYYSRLYLNTLNKLLEILNDQDKSDEVIKLCERALEMEPYEENVHIHLLKAMLKTGQSKKAMDHYEHVERLLHKEMGLEPSPALKSMLRKIQNHFIEKGELDIVRLEDQLEEGPDSGAIICEYEYFKFLYNIQKGKSLRTNVSDYVALITLGKSKASRHDQMEIEKWSKNMTQVLAKSLRKGDVFSFWNENQLLIMLHNINHDGLLTVESRIKKNLFLYGKESYMDMQIKFQPIQSANVLLNESL